jgi:hypothetical protein
MMTSFWNGLGDIFSAILSIMPTLGNVPNYLAIFIISVLFIYWTRELIIFKKKGES